MFSCEDALDSRGSPRAWRHGCLEHPRSHRRSPRGQNWRDFDRYYRGEAEGENWRRCTRAERRRRKLLIRREIILRGGWGIRTQQDSLESVSYRTRVALVAVNAMLAVAPGT